MGSSAAASASDFGRSAIWSIWLSATRRSKSSRTAPSATARQGGDDLDVLGRKLAGQAPRYMSVQRLGGDRWVRLHEGIEAEAAAGGGEIGDVDVAHAREPGDLGRDARAFLHGARAAAFGVLIGQQAAGDEDVELLAGRHPHPVEDALAGEDLLLARRQRLRAIAALVLEEVADVLIGGDAEQLGAAGEADRELEIHQHRRAVRRAQPVLLLGEVVMGDVAAMHFAQARPRRAEPGEVAMGPGQLQRHAVDEAADQIAFRQFIDRHGVAGALGAAQRLGLAAGEAAGERLHPPFHVVIAPAHRRVLTRQHRARCRARWC